MSVTSPSTVSLRLKAAYVGVAVLDTWLSGSPRRSAHAARFVTKPLLMPLLGGSLATDRRAVDSPLRRTTLAAQVGAWGGDVALLGEGTRPFVAGTASFALGHAAYLHGFFYHRDRRPIRAATAPRAVAATWALSAPVMGALAARRHRELGGPVLAYATFLAAMAAGASHLDPALPRDARLLTRGGAALFMLSDTLLGVRKFALSEPPVGLERAVMATYTAAQLLLSEGAARA